MIDMVAPDIRIRKGREFFNITPQKAYEILKLCAEQYDDSEVDVFDGAYQGGLWFKYQGETLTAMRKRLGR